MCIFLGCEASLNVIVPHIIRSEHLLVTQLIYSQLRHASSVTRIEDFYDFFVCFLAITRFIQGVFSLKFVIFFNSASSAAALVFYLPSVCTHTDTEGNRERPESDIF